jgi:hypothetical protein
MTVMPIHPWLQPNGMLLDAALFFLSYPIKATNHPFNFTAVMLVGTAFIKITNCDFFLW